MKDLELGNQLSQTTPIKCEKCGCEVFFPAYVLRHVSKLLIGASEDGVIPLNTFACAKCGHVNPEFLPEGLDSPKEESPLIMQ